MNKEYDNIEKWIGKYEVIKDCEDCKIEKELYANLSSKGICFNHRWNNPFHVKRELKEGKIFKAFLVGFAIFNFCAVEGIAGLLVYNALSELRWMSALLLVFSVVFFLLGLFVAWIWRHWIKEFSDEIKEWEKYSKDWKRKK